MKLILGLIFFFFFLFKTDKIFRHASFDLFSMTSVGNL